MRVNMNKEQKSCLKCLAIGLIVYLSSMYSPWFEAYHEMPVKCKVIGKMVMKGGKLGKQQTFLLFVSAIDYGRDLQINTTPLTYFKSKAGDEVTFVLAKHRVIHFNGWKTAFVGFGQLLGLIIVGVSLLAFLIFNLIRE